MTTLGHLSARAERGVRYSLHDVVTIEVIADEAVLAASVPAYLGTAVEAPVGGADIVVHLDPDFTASGLQLLGLNYAAYSASDFYVLHWQTGRPIARLPLDALGQRPHIECHPDFLRHHLFHSILIVTLLARGHVPLHASAFRYQGQGVLVMGWEKGGKTETLLAFANRGADYIGDEWVVLSPDGTSMFGLPFKVTIWDWQLPYLDQLLPGVTGRDRVFFRAVRAIDRIHGRLEVSPLRRLPPVGALGRALPTIRRQLRIRVQPETLFGERRVDGPTRLDRALLVIGHDRTDVTVAPLEATAIARRMPASNLFEHARLLEHYRAYRFAFPERANELLDQLAERTEASLAVAIDGTNAHEVTHPYPVSLDELFDAVAPVVAGGDPRPGPVTPEGG
ncbi:MAG: hypothetical protein AAFN30_14710 [Actinomycetota bacterium]